MKSHTITLFFLITLAQWSLQSSFCEVGTGLQGDKNNWQDLETKCYEAVTEHLHKELNASLTYLAMSAHFTTDLHYRPGTAAFFLEGAHEERQHAKALMDYVLMRGLSVKSNVVPSLVPDLRWKSIEEALTAAMDLEKKVRKDFVNIIKVCESGDQPTNQNDYHAADLMTGVFLEEQHQSIRKIAGHLATLVKMKTRYGEFAEIMFDKTLLQ